jgi:hypothetical protein
MESQPIETRVISSHANGHVQEVVRQAHEELRQLLHQRAEVMRRIGTIKQTIAGLANLFGDGVLNDELLELVDRKSNGRQPGFTKACRMILMDANRALSARDVCARIQERMPPMLERHKDPLEMGCGRGTGIVAGVSGAKPTVNGLSRRKEHAFFKMPREVRVRGCVRIVRHHHDGFVKVFIQPF